MDWGKGSGLMGQTGMCGPGPVNGEWRATGWALGTAIQDAAIGHLLQDSQRIKMSAASLLPFRPFTKLTFLCTLNSSQPVKAPNQTRRDFIPFSLNLPQVELVCLYPQLLSLRSLPLSIHQECCSGRRIFPRRLSQLQP